MMTAGQPAADVAGAPGEPRLVLESLHVAADRIVATVRVSDALHANTTPELVHAAMLTHPDLPIHTSVNGVGPTFGAVMNDTPLPHLLEHVVIDLQIASCPDPDRVFTGVTRWTDRRAGRARVEVSYADDLDALRAFRDATAFINSLPTPS